MVLHAARTFDRQIDIGRSEEPRGRDRIAIAVDHTRRHCRCFVQLTGFTCDGHGTCIFKRWKQLARLQSEVAGHSHPWLLFEYQRPLGHCNTWCRPISHK